MIKIGVLLQSEKNVGGIYQYCLSIIDGLENLDSKKYDITFFYSERFWKNKIPKRHKKVFIKKIFLFKFLRKLVHFLLPFKENWRILRNFIYEDVVAINNSDCDLIIFPSQNRAGYMTKKKSITMVHDLMHRYERHFSDYKNGIYEMREKHYKLICKYSDHIVVDSQVGKKHVTESYKRKKNIFILPFTPPSYLYQKKSKKNLQVSLPKKFIFYPAQFWEHKNHVNLIKAFNLLEKDNINLNLVFCGAKKNYYEEVLKEVKKNKLEHRIRILGRVSDESMRHIYKKSFATAFVSLLGPTNIPPLEAISLSSPLICSNVYGMKEQMQKSAIFVNPKKPIEIYRAIKKIYENKNFRKKLILRGTKLSKFKGQNYFNMNLIKILDNVSINFL